MRISEKMAEALDKQFNEELNSAYLYQSMAADFYAKNLAGFGAWMDKQAAEERTHADKIHRFLDDRGSRVHHAALPKPQSEWEHPLDAMKAALKHEEYITQCIHDLVKLSRKEGDIATEVFLGWFVNEQVEEESSVQSLIDKLEMVGDNTFGVYQLDKEVSARQ